jgi:hypothetical protein
MKVNVFNQVAVSFDQWGVADGNEHTGGQRAGEPE